MKKKLSQNAKRMADIERIVRQIVTARGKADLGKPGTMRHRRYTVAWNLANNRGLL